VLKPDDAKYVFPRWGEGLGKLGKIEEAEEKFGKAESLAQPAFDLYANWASVLVGAGRWDDAARRAAQAEELQAGSGSYACAQMAAAKGDRESVRRWLGRAAEYGLIPSLADLLRDPAMAEYRDEVAAIFPGLNV
jgi:tetratricopeptide (TPR) repeat protein